MKYLVTRDVTPNECDWLKETIKQDTIIYRFYGATYGCISPSGVAVTFSSEGDNPFFEMPYDALKELPIR